MVVCITKWVVHPSAAGFKKKKKKSWWSFFFNRVTTSYQEEYRGWCIWSTSQVVGDLQSATSSTTVSRYIGRIYTWTLKTNGPCISVHRCRYLQQLVACDFFCGVLLSRRAFFFCLLTKRLSRLRNWLDSGHTQPNDWPWIPAPWLQLTALVLGVLKLRWDSQTKKNGENIRRRLLEIGNRFDINLVGLLLRESGVWFMFFSGSRVLTLIAATWRCLVGRVGENSTKRVQQGTVPADIRSATRSSRDRTDHQTDR